MELRSIVLSQRKKNQQLLRRNSAESRTKWAAPIMDSATVPVDLTDGDALLAVDISDALSEVDKVKFTVHTRTSMPKFGKSEFSVIRLHEEFVWLHDTFADNQEYGGYIIPPPPPR